MPLRLLSVTVLFLLSTLAAQAQIEPPRGSDLRRNLLDAVRPYAIAFVGPPVEFMVNTLTVDGDAALAELTIQRPGGVAIPDWGPNDYAFIAALLQNQGGRWLVISHVVSPGEPYFCEYRSTLLRRIRPEPCF